MSSQIITANELLSGRVIYLDSLGRWVDDLTLACIYDNKKNNIDINNIINGLAKNNKIIGIYAINIDHAGNDVKPVSMKESIRSLGPTVTPNTGSFAYG